jgi:hypothetical protein
MMYNIKTGRGGVRKRGNQEIVILVSSLHRVAQLQLPFLFTDRHAYLKTAQFFSDLGDLAKIDWQILQRRDFKHDPENPGKFEQYQAGTPEEIDQFLEQVAELEKRVVLDDLMNMQTIHFQPETLTRSDLTLGHFFDYMGNFPRSHPSAEFIR